MEERGENLEMAGSRALSSLDWCEWITIVVVLWNL
jgi:hypothetical protein